MKYEFVHQPLPDWSLTEKAIIEKTIDLVLNVTDQQVIPEMARYIYEVTQVNYVTISKVLLSDNATLRTVAFMENGAFTENVTYGIAGTPCENVLSHSICYYPTGVQQEFPENLFLQQMNIESYMGIALNDTENNTIGLMALLHTSTILNAGFIDHLLTIIAPALEEYLLLTE